MNYFQEDLDGSSLFNIADFFQSKECASHFGGLYFAGSLHSDKQVIEDSLGANGDVQLALAAFLKEFAGQDAQFYVDAQNEDVKNLFKYGDSEFSEEVLYHFNSNGGEDKKCLVYSVDESGNLLTNAVNCDEKHRPLCLNINKDNLQLFADSCSNCPSQSVNVCKKWVDLADFSDGNYVVNGAHLCAKPCGQVTSDEADNWCKALDVEDLDSGTSANLFTYKSFVTSTQDVENILDGKYVNIDGPNQLCPNCDVPINPEVKIQEHLKQIFDTAAEKNMFFHSIISLLGNKSRNEDLSNLFPAFVENNLGLNKPKVFEFLKKMTAKITEQAAQEIINQYLPGHIESNTGFIQNTLLKVLQDNTEEASNKYHINLVDNNVEFSLPAGEITQSEEVQTFDELSTFFKLETKVKVNKHLDSDSQIGAWLWRFTSEDLTDFWIDLLSSNGLDQLEETYSPLQLEYMFSFGILQVGNKDESSIVIGFPYVWTFGFPNIPIELDKWYAIEASHIKVIF